MFSMVVNDNIPIFANYCARLDTCAEIDDGACAVWIANNVNIHR